MRFIDLTDKLIRLKIVVIFKATKVFVQLFNPI